MGMTPSQFFESFVEWNLADCYDSPGDIRRAFNAAVSASHLADHYFSYYRRHKPTAVAGFKDIGQLVEHITTRTDGAFRDVRSVSNVYKHLYSDKGSLAQYSSVNSCGSIQRLELSSNETVSSFEEDFFLESGGDGRARVIITRKDGTESELLPLLESVADYFRGILYADE